MKNVPGLLGPCVVDCLASLAPLFLTLPFLLLPFLLFPPLHSLLPSQPGLCLDSVVEQ